MINNNEYFLIKFSKLIQKIKNINAEGANIAKEFIEKKTFIKLWIKFIKRYLYIQLRGQNSL